MTTTSINGITYNVTRIIDDETYQKIEQTLFNYFMNEVLQKREEIISNEKTGDESTK